MRKKLLLSILTLALTGAVTHAEEMKKVEPPIQVTQVNVIQPNVSPDMILYAVKQERRAIFEAATADLLKDDAAKSAFWEVYNGYEQEKAVVAEARMAIIADYATNFHTMSDVKVKELLGKSYKNQAKALKIRNKYTHQLVKKVNATVAGRFWQVDDFVDSAVKVSLLANIPLLGEKLK